MAGYKYRGTDRSVINDPLTRAAHLFDPAKCGTYSNYRQHRRTKTPICEACRQVSNAYDRERYARQRALKAGS